LYEQGHEAVGIDNLNDYFKYIIMTGSGSGDAVNK
tara:strand:- start:282 stop:386 length:105 start_codon:yes stop_codon:yes gene_type:complete